MTDPLGAAAGPEAPPETKVAPAKAITIRYLGFKDVDGRRQYALQAQRGLETSQYTVSIELAAFSKKQALLQDGPDICYQKLLREVAGSELTGPEDIEVTEGDLLAYRENHAAPARKSFSPPRPPAPTPAVETPAPVDGGEIA